MSYNVGATSGNLVLLSEQIVTGNASITITNISGYDNYYLLVYGMTTSGGSGNILLTMSVNNGSSFIATGYYIQGVQATDAVGPGLYGQANAANILLDTAVADSASFPWVCQATFFNLNSATFSKIVHCTTTGNNNNGGGAFWKSFGGWCNTTSGVNAIKIAPAAGTFVTGTFKFYGIQN